jgi:hypothetical protein
MQYSSCIRVHAVHMYCIPERPSPWMCWMARTARAQEVGPLTAAQRAVRDSCGRRLSACDWARTYRSNQSWNAAILHLVRLRCSSAAIEVRLFYCHYCHCSAAFVLLSHQRLTIKLDGG